MTTIGVAVITHCARHHMERCLPPLLRSPLNPKVVVVNSSSQDGTVERAREMGADTLVIPRKEFNHGSTREKVRKYLGTDIVVMITPDAYAIDEHMLGHLIAPIQKGIASVSYARQLPHDGADFLESFARIYNYPKESHVRAIGHASQYGVYTLFCSNACAAYNNQALDEIGGFPTVLLGEDTFAVAKLLKRGHQIAYVAEALVKHSHRYSLLQEFRRNFDTGLARKLHEDLIREYGRDEKRGKEYVKQMCKQLWKEKPHLLPYAYLQTLAKFVGYKLGRRCVKAPLWIKKALSSQDFYWVSTAYTDIIGSRSTSKDIL